MKARERFRAGADVKLREGDAGSTPLRDPKDRDKLSKDEIKQQERDTTAQLTAHIAQCQEMLYAQRQRKLLIVLQGMDTSGKDGTVRALFSQINPMGLRGVTFKAPNPQELAHDYLWRVHQQVPTKGEIAIFNRSHYEDVLITIVQDMIDEKECKRRYAHIRDFERMLAETGTVIVKIFLHISRDEQRKRLQERLDDPDKQWKFDEGDLVQRLKWDDYQRAYERAIMATDADHAPWYIIPADSKTHRNLLISTLLLEIMQGLKLSFPEPDPRLTKMKVV
ncbi:PPK2 family polyphosphate kinase [Massilia sp. TSP1-1-2]|uniref:PPK2 family polyphosphate kinase n=1 Tax=unclassified Massilia TaxID=2609279 RepID=UPI003CEF22D7